MLLFLVEKIEHGDRPWIIQWGVLGRTFKLTDLLDKGKMHVCKLAWPVLCVFFKVMSSTLKSALCISLPNLMMKILKSWVSREKSTPQKKGQGMQGETSKTGLHLVDVSSSSIEI